MACKLDIEIQTRKMLKPSAPTPDNLRRLKLSLFDQLGLRTYIPILFNYLPSSSSSYDDDKLEKSLAETLTKFYPFAGRFAKDDPFSIDCNDEGVEYVQTKVNAADLPEFLHRQAHNDIESSLLHLILPDMVHSPLVGVQVNVFNNGGIAIGIKISHIIADAFTIATFVNEWAHTCLTGRAIRTTTQDNPASFGQLSSLFPAKVLQFPYSPNTVPADIVTRRFVFDALAIENLRKTIKDNDDMMMKQPSRVVVIMSLIWKVLTHISSAKNNGNSRDSSLGFSINLRGKVSCTAPSLEHALGNYVMIGIANRKAYEARRKDDELNDFVKLVGNTIRDTCETIGKAESVDDISSLTLNNRKKGVEKLLQGDKMDVYTTTSWCKLPWYEADFGWGKPFWVSPVGVNLIEGALLMDTKDGNGIQLTICLKEKKMTEFEKHLHILSSTPIVG